MPYSSVSAAWPTCDVTDRDTDDGEPSILCLDSFPDAQPLADWEFAIESRSQEARVAFREFIDARAHDGAALRDNMFWGESVTDGDWGDEVVPPEDLSGWTCVEAFDQEVRSRGGGSGGKTRR
jgi:hypothetical protein